MSRKPYKKQSMVKSEQVMTRLTKEERQDTEDMAYDNDHTMSSIIRIAVKEKIAKWKKSKR